jgi:hypothetical protein
MKTNDMKKGTRVMLRGSNWEADIADNMKGNTRIATVYGFETEMGSIYTHDIVAYKDANGVWQKDIEYTPSQIKCRKFANEMFGG